jgi:hypothetical protein
MSKIQVNEIVNHFDNGAPDCPRGLTVTGVSTFSGSVSIGGTLTYEDVTNIDSVGIITAQQGLDAPTDLVLRTGGTERLRVTSAGITSITGSLEVNGNNYPATGALSNRNLIINGAMQVAQRGTSQTAAAYGSIDRWYSGLSGATITMSQESFTLGQTDVPGANKYLKSSVTTGNNNSGIYYKIEAQDAFPAINNDVTLSYYAKGVSPTSGLQVGIKWFDGSSASAIASESVTLTASWVKYTHTFTVPSISGLTMTNESAYLEVAWQQKNSDTGTAAYEVNLAQVQLEVGTKATPFEHRSYGDELAKCQRYYETSYPTGYGEGHDFDEVYPFATSKPLAFNFIASDDTISAQSCRFKVNKRANATVRLYSAKDGTLNKAFTYKGTGANASNVNIAVVNPSQDHTLISTSLGAVNQCNESYFHVVAESEL